MFFFFKYFKTFKLLEGTEFFLCIYTCELQDLVSLLKVFHNVNARETILFLKGFILEVWFCV